MPETTPVVTFVVPPIERTVVVKPIERTFDAGQDDPDEAEQDGPCEAE